MSLLLAVHLEFFHAPNLKGNTDYSYYTVQIVLFLDSVTLYILQLSSIWVLLLH